MPLVLDSTEPPVIEAGLQWHRRQGDPQLGQPRGRRGARAPASTGCSRWPREYGAAVICLLHRRGGPGPRRRVEAAGRPPHLRPRRRALRPRAERPDLRRPHLPALDRRRRPAPRRHGDHRGHPAHQGRAARRVTPSSACRTCRFGLKPAARHVLNSVFLHECVEAGLDAAIVHAARIMPLNRIPDEQRAGLPRPHLRPPRATATTRCTELLDVFDDVEAGRRSRRRTARGWPVEERLKHRIIDGDRDGLDADLDEAMAGGIAAARDHQRRAARRA